MNFGTSTTRKELRNYCLSKILQGIYLKLIEHPVAYLNIKDYIVIFVQGVEGDGCKKINQELILNFSSCKQLD